MRRIWLLAIVAALITTACRVEVNLLIDLAEDGSGSLAFEIGTDEEFRQLAESEGGELDVGEISEAFEGTGSQVELSQRTEGDMEFDIATVNFSNIDELRGLISQGDLEMDGLEEVQIEYEGDTVSLAVTLEDGGVSGLGDAGDDLGGDFAFDGLASGFIEQFFSASVIASMPGEVTSHNADRVLPDGRLAWDIPLDGSDLDIQAVSDFSSGSGIPAWLIAVLALIAVAVAAFVIMRARERASSVAAVTAAAGDGTAAPEGWGDIAPSESASDSVDDDADGATEGTDDEAN